MVVEWHNVGEWRFGWVARLNSSRFTVAHRPWWRIGGRHKLVTQGLIEYGIVNDDEMRARAAAAIAIEPGIYAADMRRVIIHTDDGLILDPRLAQCMILRWEEMQRRLRG